MEKNTSAYRQKQGRDTLKGSEPAQKQEEKRAERPFIATPETLLSDPNLSDRALRVALALIRCAARKGEIRVSQDYLSKQLGNRSLDYIKRGLKELKAQGYVVTKRTGRTNEHYLTPLLDTFQELNFEGFSKALSRSTSKRKKSLENKTSKPIRESRFATSDSADLPLLQIQIDLIQNKQSEPDLEPDREARFDDDLIQEPTPETSHSLGFEVWLKEVLEKSSRLVGSRLNLNATSEKLSNSVKALKKFYDLKGTPSEVADLVSYFLENYPSEVRSRAALVAANFEAILNQTPKADKALEGSLEVSEWLSDPLETLLETEPFTPTPPPSKEELEALEKVREARFNSRELEQFRSLVQKVRPETSEQELSLLFEEVPRVTRNRLNLFSEKQLLSYVEELLADLKERVN